MKQPLLISNWKMMVGNRESVALCREVMRFLRGKVSVPELVLCPSFTALTEVKKTIGRSRIHVGAQDMSWELSGAYTGEVSARALAEIGCRYVLLGHSERRAFCGETNERIAQKIALAFQQKVTPILCVGESVKERANGKGEEAVLAQVEAALSSRKTLAPLVIAYEPCWAISTQKPTEVSVADMRPTMQALHDWVEKQYGPNGRSKTRFVYGGSVTDKNAYGFLQDPLMDGLLIGSASTKLQTYFAIVQAARNFMEIKT